MGTNAPRDPSEVSGWGFDADGRPRQDFSDIAKECAKNPEFEGMANETTRGRADATEK